VLETLNEVVGAGTDVPDTGDIVADLNAKLAVVARLLSDGGFVPVYTGLIAAAQSDVAVAAELLETILKPRVGRAPSPHRACPGRRSGRTDLDPHGVVEALYDRCLPVAAAHCAGHARCRARHDRPRLLRRRPNRYLTAPAVSPFTR
jgi:hypothetical protein